MRELNKAKIKTILKAIDKIIIDNDYDEDKIDKAIGAKYNDFKGTDAPGYADDRVNLAYIISDAFVSVTPKQVAKDGNDAPEKASNISDLECENVQIDIIANEKVRELSATAYVSFYNEFTEEENRTSVPITELINELKSKEVKTIEEPIAENYTKEQLDTLKASMEKEGYETRQTANSAMGVKNILVKDVNVKVLIKAIDNSLQASISNAEKLDTESETIINDLQIKREVMPFKDAQTKANELIAEMNKLIVEEVDDVEIDNADDEDTIEPNSSIAEDVSSFFHDKGFDKVTNKVNFVTGVKNANDLRLELSLVKTQETFSVTTYIYIENNKWDVKELANLCLKSNVKLVLNRNLGVKSQIYNLTNREAILTYLNTVLNMFNSVSNQRGIEAFSLINKKIVDGKEIQLRLTSNNKYEVGILKNNTWDVLDTYWMNDVRQAQERFSVAVMEESRNIHEKPNKVEASKEVNDKGELKKDTAETYEESPINSRGAEVRPKFNAKLSKEQKDELKSLAVYAKKIAKEVNKYEDFSLVFIEEEKEFKKLDINQVALALIYYGKEESIASLSRHNLFKLMMKSKLIRSIRPWRKIKFNNEICYMTLFESVKNAEEN